VVSHTGEVIGGLFFGHSRPDVFTERSERLVAGIAAQAAIAFDNARLYEQAQKEIEERKRTETALHEAQLKLSQHAEHLENQVAERTAHLRESIRSLESLCYTIAHDLRAPLRTVQGFTEILEEDYAEAFDSEGRRLTARIMDAAIRMDRLIRDLLEYAKLGHAELPCQTLELNTAVQKALDDLNEVIVKKNARIHLQPLPRAWGNTTICEQVFTNLLSNALKFVKEGVTPTIEIWSEIRAQEVRVFVRDNGIGIALSHHERIFEVFQRLHDDENKYSGTGVGLAIVKKGMERMGGTVVVDPLITNGTSIYLDFQPPRES
jgi:light-regulated signal transduction histidine kinase (bacteriophytochrome)